MNPSVVAAHKRIGLLQKLNKWQGKAMEKMQKSMDKMVRNIKNLEKKVSGSSSKKKKTPMAPTFPRSRSLITTPRRLPAQEPHRASSFEPREEGDNTQRRRKSSKARRSNSTTGLDPVQTEETQLGRADGRADLDLSMTRHSTKTTHRETGTLTAGFSKGLCDLSLGEGSRDDLTLFSLFLVFHSLFA
ncbi:unnamed protein product [Microthlaspi erraticum]|uniref:Uncharacterized protein n=1 Tax=Microthlaspi erraticum TaxID=1685480 RepID=A0A6D2J883_9BRAS|nr:unnamed protein product [Microthlaspi erraticum]